MAKKNGDSKTAIAKPEVRPLAVYDPMTSPASEALIKSQPLPVLHVFQDNGDEADQYGQHPKGTIIDALTCEVVVPAGEARNFVCINRQPKYLFTVWPRKRDRQPPIFTTELDLTVPAGRQIPLEYLTPPNPATGDPGGRINSFDDEARGLQIRVNWAYAVLFAPNFDQPYMALFSWTSQRTGETIERKENLRASMKMLGGLWSLRTRERRNDQGVWWSPTVALAGDAPELAVQRVRAYLSGQANILENIGWGEEVIDEDFVPDDDTLADET